MGTPDAITWPIAATGIATKNSPLMLAPGGQLLLDNCRQERKDEWRTRPGFNRDTANDLPGGNVPVIATEAPWGGLVGLTRETGAATAARVFNRTVAPRWVSPTSQVYAAGDPLQLCAQTTPGIWSRNEVGYVDQLAYLSQAAVAEGGGYRLTAWWSVNQPGIQVALTSLDGAMISYFSQFAQLTTSGRPRVVYSSTAGMLVLFWTDATLNRVYAFRWSTTTGLPVGLGATTIMAVNANGTAPYMDALWYGGATITVVYRDNVATGGVRQLEYNPVTDVTTSYTPGVNCANCLSLFTDPDASGSRFIGVSTNAPDTRVVKTSNVGVIQTNFLVQAITSENIAGVAYAGEWMVVYSGVTGAFLRAAKLGGGVVSAIYDYGCTGYVDLATNAWREPSTDAMRFVVYTDGRLSASGNDQQPTFLEMALPYTGTSNVVNSWCEPQTKILPLNAAGRRIVAAGISQVQRTGTDRFVTALGRITKNNLSAFTQGPSIAVDAWAVQYMNSTTYTGQNQGQGTLTEQDAYLPVGNLMHTATGTRPCALGSSTIPYFPTLTASVGAGTLALKTYFYKITVTLTDEAGNEWESPASIANSLTLTGAQNTITVDAYLSPFENATRVRKVKVWRTDGNGSAYKLLTIVTDTVANTLHVTFVDSLTDVIAGEPFTAEVQAGITPSMNHIAIWGDRMWGADRDYPTRVRFSKPLETGLLPHFPTGVNTAIDYAIDLDDQYGPITGMAALDDKLIVTKRRAIYVISGEGPDNAGNGAFPASNRISSEIGHIAGAPIVSTGREAYIVGLSGVCRVNGSQEIDYVGAAIEKYLQMPLIASQETVIGMVVSPRLYEVRIQTRNYRFVHDRTFDVWYRDTGGMGSASGIVMTKMLGSETQCMFTSTGQFWIEAPDSVTPNDAGTSYAGTVRSAWVRPASMDGRILLYRGRCLGECTAAGTVAQPTLTIYFDNDDSIYETFQPIENITNDVGPIRAEGQVRRQKCTSFSMQLTLPLGDASVRLDAWAASVEVLPGLVPLSRAQKWRSGTVTQATTAATGLGLTLNSFGLTPITNNAPGALRQDSEWYVNLSQFSARIVVRLSAVAKITATDVAAYLAVWASATEGDISGTGSLLAQLSTPLAGTAGVYAGYAIELTTGNPGGVLYVGLTSRAGTLASVATQLNYYGALIQIENAP